MADPEPAADAGRDVSTGAPSHRHDHGAAATLRARKHRWPLAFMAVAMGMVAIAEAIGGWMTGSLALLADAAHAMTDVLSLGLALLATWIVSRAAASPSKSFGYYRAEILAAFANAVFLGVLAVFIVIEALERATGGHEVDGARTAIIATGILALEIVGLVVLHRMQGESLNIRSAFLHLLGDAASTAGVIAAGTLIAYGGDAWLWLDPAVSVGISLLLGFWALRLIQETGHILMEGTPPELDPEAIRAMLRQIDGVDQVHDLHVWSLTSGFHSMSVHVVADHVDPKPAIAERARERLGAEFDIGHVTIQLEDPRDPCASGHD